MFKLPVQLIQKLAKEIQIIYHFLVLYKYSLNDQTPDRTFSIWEKFSFDHPIYNLDVFIRDVSFYNQIPTPSRSIYLDNHTWQRTDIEDPLGSIPIGSHPHIVPCKEHRNFHISTS